MPANTPPSRPDPTQRLPRPASRAIVLEDIARAFLRDSGADPRAAAAFADIGAALLPHVELSTAVAIARMLAGRNDAPAAVLAALAARGLRPKGVVAAESAPVANNVARDEPTPAAPDVRPQLLTACAATRARLIDEAARHGALDSGPELRRRVDAVATLALARAAERRDRDDVVAILARVLATSAAALAPLFEEESGELIAIACRAAGLDEEDALRILVGAGPARARRGAGLKAALAVFQRLERTAAFRLLAAATGQELTLRSDFGAVTESTEARRRVATSATLSPLFNDLSGQTASSAAPTAGNPRAPVRSRG